MDLEKKIEELSNKVTELILTVQTLEQRISDLENGEYNTGIFVDGCPDAVKTYLDKSNKKKEGE